MGTGSPAEHAERAPAKSGTNSSWIRSRWWHITEEDDDEEDDSPSGVGCSPWLSDSENRDPAKTESMRQHLLTCVQLLKELQAENSSLCEELRCVRERET